jgi:hypothetical protein
LQPSNTRPATSASSPPPPQGAAIILSYRFRLMTSYSARPWSVYGAGQRGSAQRRAGRDSAPFSAGSHLPLQFVCHRDDVANAREP